MQKFIRSSCRTKDDPGYYKKIIDRLQPKRDELLNQAEAAGDVFTTDPESDFRRLADKMTAKIQWAIFQLRVSINLAELKNVYDRKGK